MMHCGAERIESGLIRRAQSLGLLNIYTLLWWLFPVHHLPARLTRSPKVSQ